MHSALSWIFFAFLWCNFLSPSSDIEERSPVYITQTADSLSKAEQYNEALNLYENASAIYYQNLKWDLYVSARIKISNVQIKQQKYKQAGNTLRELANEVIRRLGSKSTELGQVYNKLGIWYYRLEDYDNSIVYFKNALKIKTFAPDKDPLDIANTYYNLGISYQYKGHLIVALSELKKSLSIREKHADNLMISKSCLGLGKVYEEIGDYRSALEYYKQALELLKKSSPDTDSEIAACYNYIGIAFYEKKEFSKALENLFISLKLFSKLRGEQDFNVSNCYNNIGNVYDDQGQYSKALDSYLMALTINKAIVGEVSNEVADNYNNIGITLRKLNKYKEATQNLQSALIISKKIHSGKNIQRARVYDNLGDVSLKQKKYSEALNFYQSAIINTVLNFNNSDIRSNPAITSDKIIGSKIHLLTFLSSKAKCLKYTFLQTKSPEDLLLSLETYELADQLIDIMREDYEFEDSKLFLSSEAVPFYEQAIETAFLLYKQKGDIRYFNQAFHFAEKNKAIIVLEALKDLEAKSFANIPATLLAEETNLKVDLAFYEKKLVEEELQPKKDSLAPKMRNKLLKLRRQYNVFIKKMEEKYPAYHRLKYNRKIVSVAQVEENLLDSATSLIEYFIGDSSIYIFKIAAEKSAIVRLTKDFPLEKWVEDFLLSMNGKLAIAQSSDGYRKSSFNLYTKLFSPILSEGALPQRLIVIPDGILGYIPFDALLTKDCKPGLGFKEYPFLLKKHGISYAYSATVLMQAQQKTSDIKGLKAFLGIAPVFSKSNNFTFLQHSEKEVNDIRQKLGGEVLIAHEATKEAFKSSAPEYNILHISSHSYVLDSMPQYSWIGFSDEGLSDENNYKLYLSELYAMRLNAEMVVLSACETGGGRLSKGEGIMSMARGFAYAGCASIITTLWPVNHSATTQIMAKFYSYLAEGLPKDIALRQAKLDYLQSEQIDNIGVHPFFWAAYVPIGDRGKIDLKKDNLLLIYLISVGLIITFGFVGWKYKKRSMQDNKRPFVFKIPERSFSIAFFNLNRFKL